MEAAEGVHDLTIHLKLGGHLWLVVSWVLIQLATFLLP